MVVSLLWAGGLSTTTAGGFHTLGTYPATGYGTNPLGVQFVAGLGSTPNGGNLVEAGFWGPSNVSLSPHYNSTATQARVDASHFATDYISQNAGFEDEGHVGYFNSGGSTLFGGDSSAELAGLAFIIGIDDVLLDGRGIVTPSVNGQSFTGSPFLNQGCLVGNFIVGRNGQAGSWAFHSVSGVISDNIGGFPVVENINREIGPFAIGVVYGHSLDAPPYSTPDLVGGLPSWSMIGFQQIDHYFVAAALWVPPDPSNIDYSFNFSGFPTSDWGSIAIYTLNFPPLPPTHPYAAIIG